MICTFILSILIISGVSIIFFIVFLDYVLLYSVDNIFTAHTHSIIGDIL